MARHPKESRAGEDAPHYQLTDTLMSYMKDLEAELRAKLSGITDDAEERDAFIKYVKALVLTSYRNGQKAGAPKRRERKTAKAAPAECMYNHDHAQNDGQDCMSHD